MLEAHGTAVDPITGLPKVVTDRDKLRIVEEKVKQAEVVAQNVLHDLTNEPGQHLLKIVYQTLVERLESLMMSDEKCKTLLEILDALNAKISVAPVLARTVMQHRLPKGVMR